jgi:hypothetical protein
VGEAGGGRLAQQGGVDAPDARQLVAASGAGPLTVGATWRRPALVAVASVLVLAPMLALAGAGPLDPARWRRCRGGRTPVLAAAALAGAGALAGAVSGLLAGPRAVDALSAGVVGLLEAGMAAGAGPPDGPGR